MLRRSNQQISQPISILINDSLYQTLPVCSHYCHNHFIMKANLILKMEIYNKTVKDLGFVAILCVDQIKPFIILPQIA